MSTTAASNGGKARRLGRLALADGTVFEGELFGRHLDDGASIAGEVVFTTGMTGYQEVLTDPSFFGQIVTMTSPHIGNTGVNEEDPEREGGPAVRGFVVRELSEVASSWRATDSLDHHFGVHGVVGLTGIDTRRLTRKLRDDGSQNGAIGALSTADLVDLARAAPKMEGLDLASEVTAKSVRTYESSLDTTTAHVVAMDLGMKTNILRSLRGVGCRVTVVPSRTTAEEILALGPDGIFVSNGPGDPAAVTYAIDTIRGLLGKRPLFGICLGHQLLALALGGRTYKLKFGHRGLNQPVVDLATRKVSITSQNHGFAVDTASLPRGARPSFSHLNDDTSEGLDVPEARAFSVQFHPEAAAGPHDTLSLFSRFVRDMSAPAT